MKTPLTKPKLAREMRRFAEIDMPKIIYAADLPRLKTWDATLQSIGRREFGWLPQLPDCRLPRQAVS